MKDEYDFSKGERGKFFREGGRPKVPVYRDDEVGEYLHERAQVKGLEVGRLVNDLPGGRSSSSSRSSSLGAG